MDQEKKKVECSWQDMADLHRWIELSGLSSDSRLDEKLNSLSLRRAKHAQTPYDIEEADFPGIQVGWYVVS